MGEVTVAATNDSGTTIPDVDCVMSDWSGGAGCTNNCGVEFVHKGSCFRYDGDVVDIAFTTIPECRAEATNHGAPTFTYNVISQACKIYLEEDNCKSLRPKSLKYPADAWFEQSYYLADASAAGSASQLTRSVVTPAQGFGQACPADLTKAGSCADAEDYCEGIDFCSNYPLISQFEVNKIKGKKKKFKSLQADTLDKLFCKCAYLCKEEGGYDTWILSKVKVHSIKGTCECRAVVMNPKKTKRYSFSPVVGAAVAGMGSFDPEVMALLKSKTVDVAAAV